jgi:hypothetical protein
MKHLRPMTKNATPKADVFQDTICIVINFIGTLFDAFGATSPFLNVLLDKCDPTTGN